MLELLVAILAICTFFSSPRVQAEGYTDFENKVFLIGQHKSLGKGYLSHDGLKLTAVNNDEALKDQNIMASSLFMYRNDRIRLAVINSDGYQRCLTNIGNRQLQFRICDETWDAQKFDLVEKLHKSGTYHIKNGDQCLTKLTSPSATASAELYDCSSSRSEQDFTPAMVSTPVNYTITNENTGDQHVRLGFKWNGFSGNPHLWLEAFKVPGKTSVTKLIPDYTAYGIGGNSWIYNKTYSTADYNLGDHKAGDNVSITMPLRGDINKSATSKVVPIVTASDGIEFRIDDNQGAVAYWISKKIISWDIPEGWILNVHPKSNFEGGFTQLTSASESAGMKMPTSIGSIAIVQRADAPIRMQSEDDGSWRYGEFIVTKDAPGFISFYRKQASGEIKFVGPINNGQDNEIGYIRALHNVSDPSAKENAFYMRKRKSSEEIPFSNRHYWESINIGSWLNHEMGSEGQLYTTYNTTTNLSRIWRLMHDGAGFHCLPDSGVDNNWEHMGDVFGKINTVNNDHPGVRLFSGKGYQGDKVKIIENIPDLCHMNNVISSYTIPAGWQVQFFTGKNFTGNKYTRSGSSTNLGGFDDKIQSIKIIKRN